ncbi:MAG: amino acid permease [Parachlamydiaceae bacterium]|nr:amino acid permease [Parachlamydiaceae bacterium]
MNVIAPTNNDTSTPDVGETKKFGTFLGVFVPCILMLFGVIIFLRLGWVVGLVGISETLIIVTLAALIALVTTLSMSAIATNIEVGKGGMYYMLSRSLGIEAGGALGIPLFFRQSLTIAFCCIGFGESLHDLVPAWSITNIGIITLCILTTLAYTSVSGALKVQIAIFIAILFSLISFFTGGDVPPMDPATFTPPPLNTLGFWSVFAIFFPAMTGMESSVSLSGDLKNPSRSLPIGTISATLTAYLIYVGMCLFLAYKVPMDRLVADPLIMQDIASIPSLIIVGIWGATLSSALGGLLGAPRTLQAISDDGLAPKIFGKPFGALGEPRIATLATFGIALFGTYFGSINILAPLLTMVSLICYGTLNLSAGLETLMANPSWRPRFKVHWGISLSGALLCLIAMLMIDAGSAILCIMLVTFIYFFVRQRQYESSWTDIRDGILLFFSRSAIYRLALSDGPSKSWRPHFLVFTEPSIEQSTAVLNFAQGISRSKGFLTMASFVTPEMGSVKRKELSDSLMARFKKDNIDALVQIKKAEKVNSGMYSMIEYYGIGPLVPNTIVFGGLGKGDKTIDFVNVLRLAYQNKHNIVILNEAEKLATDDSNDLHFWWDDQHKNNSEFMLVLGYMLQLNFKRKNSKICTKAIVQNEFERIEMQKQLSHISLTKRIAINAEVYVSADLSESKEDLIKEFSRNAGMVFVGLKPPPKDTSKMDAYIVYLQGLAKNFEGLPLALVLSSDGTPLDTILE